MLLVRETRCGSGYFVELDGETVGIGQEREAPAGELVGAQGLARYAPGAELADGGGEVGDGKGNVAQATGFGMRGPRRRSGEGEKFEQVGVAQGEVGLPGAALGAIVLCQEAETEEVDVETL